MAGVASAGRLLRLILSRKMYLTTHDPAAHLASLFAIVTATSRNLQHLRGRTALVPARTVRGAGPGGGSAYILSRRVVV